ncbi:hypothetical protein E1267_11285 [Nonomuraea longispora]|uniref:PaaI family thioesterase n=1 Tax=Nonomuraea longispora TaxID=1848320 RepID=A0A4V2XKW6_9ACTN|nr:hypothetical protein [Nonomuraea longispora]TDC08186.1 hypothetical protein E1267_11285 [Nonomuraea longispora]
MTRSPLTTPPQGAAAPAAHPEAPPPEVIGMSVYLFRKPYATGRLDTDYLLPVPVGTTLHLRAWCNGIAGRKAYLEAEGRIGATGGPVAVRAAALFIEVNMEHFAKHGDLAAVAAEHDYEVNP